MAISPKSQIPAAFVRRAQQHLAETGAPLLDYRQDGYRTTLLAWGGSASYTLSEDGWEPPFTTWREYFKSQGLDGEEIQARIDAEGLGVPLREEDEVSDDGDDAAEMDVEAFYELDAEIVDPYDYINPRETAEGQAYGILERLRLPRVFECPELGSTKGELGSLDFTEGLRPGDDTMLVSVSSPLALSCLQYLLDEINSGIRIKLAD